MFVAWLTSVIVSVAWELAFLAGSTVFRRCVVVVRNGMILRVVIAIVALAYAMSAWAGEAFS